MNKPIARVYLPQVSRKYAAIMNAEMRLNKAQPGAVKYERDESDDRPEGAAPTAWWAFTSEAVKKYRALGAIIVAVEEEK